MPAFACWTRCFRKPYGAFEWRDAKDYQSWRIIHYSPGAWCLGGWKGKFRRIRSDERWTICKTVINKAEWHLPTTCVNKNGDEWQVILSLPNLKGPPEINSVGFFYQHSLANPWKRNPEMLKHFTISPPSPAICFGYIIFWYAGNKFWCMRFYRNVIVFVNIGLNIFILLLFA